MDNHEALRILAWHKKQLPEGQVGLQTALDRAIIALSNGKDIDMCDDEKTMLNPMLQLVELKKAFDGAVKLAEDSVELARKIERDLNDCRNELCLKCGKYTESYKGACKGCRWE